MPASNRSARDRGVVYTQDQKNTYFLVFYQQDKRYDILPLDHPDWGDKLSRKEKLELIEGQAIWLYHKGNRFEGLMLRKGSYEKVAKKRDNLVRELDESNPDVSVNHLDFLDISESCHSSASKVSQGGKKNVRTKGTSNDNQAQRAEKPSKAKKLLAFLESESSGAESATENDDEKKGNAGRKSVSMGEMTSVLSGEKTQEMSSDSDSEKENYEPPAKKLQVSFSDENAACSNNPKVIDNLEKKKEMRKNSVDSVLSESLIGSLCGVMRSVKDSLDQSRREMRRQRQFLERLTFSTDSSASNSAAAPTQQTSTEDIWFDDVNLSSIEGNRPGVYGIRMACALFTVTELKEGMIDPSKSDEKTRSMLSDRKVDAIRRALEQRYPIQWEHAKSSINQKGLDLRKPQKVNVPALLENNE